MKPFHPLPLSASVLVASLAVASQAVAQFVVDIPGGSENPQPPLVIAAAAGTTVLPLPPDGVLDYESITVEQGATLRFERNALNTPVTLFSSGPIVVNGTIDVSGSPGTATDGGQPGQGGFWGGKPGVLDLLPGPGLGPGGARLPDQVAAHATMDSRFGGSAVVYGNKYALQLNGGSGASGRSGSGGGGGGGAILLCSDVSIEINGLIDARGGGDSGNGGGGSGGCIRAVAPIVSGNGTLDAFGGFRRFGGTLGSGGAGWIRIDALDRRQMSLNLQTATTARSQGTILVARLPAEPVLSIVSVAGIDSDGSLLSLPPGSDEMQPVVVRAANFGTLVDIEIAVTPLQGEAPEPIPFTIDNTGGGPTDTMFTVPIPANADVVVQVWKR